MPLQTAGGEAVAAGSQAAATASPPIVDCCKLLPAQTAGGEAVAVGSQAAATKPVLSCKAKNETHYMLYCNVNSEINNAILMSNT